MLALLPPFSILLAIALWSAVHSLLAADWVKEVAAARFGDLAKRGYRLAYNLFSLISFLPVLALPLVLPDRTLYRIAPPWFYLTLAIQGGMALVVLVGLLQTGLASFLGVRQLAGPANGDQRPLIVKGLYRWVRHPLYTAGLVFIWLTPVMTLNLLAMDIGLSVYLVVGATFEERRLAREYGQSYLDYRAETPMLIPGWGSKKREKSPLAEV